MVQHDTIFNTRAQSFEKTMNHFKFSLLHKSYSVCEMGGKIKILRRLWSWEEWKK